MWRREQAFLRTNRGEQTSWLDQKLAGAVPEKLRRTLRDAFIKAFALVLDKGDGILHWAGRSRTRSETYQVQQYAADLREDRKSLRAFSKTASSAGRGSVLLAGAEGIGLGLLGIGIPDIPLFSAMLLKSVYETAASFGFPCRTDAERMFALRLIEAAMSCGSALERRNRELNEWLQQGVWPTPTSLDEQVRATAGQLSDALLYRKFLQGIPVAGAVGGAYDAVCLRRVQRYAAIKYQRRFLLERKRKQAEN